MMVPPDQVTAPQARTADWLRHTPADRMNHAAQRMWLDVFAARRSVMSRFETVSVCWGHGSCVDVQGAAQVRVHVPGVNGSACSGWIHWVPSVSCADALVGNEWVAKGC